MSGVSITLPGADLSAVAVKFIAPVMSNLEYWNYFGDQAGNTGRNMVSGKPAGTVTGTPVVNAGYVTLQGQTNFVETGLLDQAEVTILSVSRAPAFTPSAFSMVVTAYNGPNAATGSGLLFTNAATNPQAEAFVSRNTGSADVVLASAITGGSTATWSFYAMRAGAGYNRVDDKTKGLSAIGAVTNPRSTPNGFNYRIGSCQAAIGHTSAYQTLTDQAFVGIYSRTLTDLEIASIYARVQAYLALKSITV